MFIYIQVWIEESKSDSQFFYSDRKIANHFLN